MSDRASLNRLVGSGLTEQKVSGQQPEKSTSTSNASTASVTTLSVVPSNDNFADSIVLTGFSDSDTGSNLGATGESGEPDHAFASTDFDGLLNSVWWSWTAPDDGVAFIDTFGSNFDTTLGVYTGSSVGSLTEVASNDDSFNSFNFESEVSFPTTAGTTYQIAVDGFDSSVGDITVNVNLFEPPEPPSNDDFADSIVLSGSSLSTTGSNIAATGEVGEPDHAFVSTDFDGLLNSVWWSWTAPDDGFFAIDTFGSDYDTSLAVYTGSAVDSLTEVASNDDSFFSLESEVQFEATAGTTYQIAVDGFIGSVGEITLNIDESEATPGDDNIDGTPGDDFIDALAGNDTVSAGGGADVIFGSEGDDLLKGQGGDDNLDGGEGNDELLGGGGNDFLFGDVGDDILKGQGGADDLEGGEGNDKLLGGGGNDFLFGDVGEDLLRGQNGDDFLDGWIGDDRLFGGDGDDVLLGFDGDDLLKGEAGNDELLGEAGDDRLFGGDGDDILNGTGFGLIGIGERDVLEGGAGSDIFVLGDFFDIYYDDNAASVSASNAGRAIIKDFVPGEDIIELSAFGTYEFQVTNNGSTRILETSDPVKEVIAIVQGVAIDASDTILV